MLNKINQYNIDLFIEIINEDKFMYVVAPFEYYANYNFFKLQFSFEDWSCFYQKDYLNEKKHIEIIAEYVNAKGDILVKFQDENFESLCEKIQDWCMKHVIC